MPSSELSCSEDRIGMAAELPFSLLADMLLLRLTESCSSDMVGAAQLDSKFWPLVHSGANVSRKNVLIVTALEGAA